MGDYGFLAGSYDALTTDVDYPLWADYIEKQFAKAKRPVRTVLDLGCGTGTLACLLAERGYEVIGVDPSPEMLAQAAEKGAHCSGVPPLFLCQSMEELDLYGTVDACICCLDAVNHVTRPALLRRGFARVCLFLEPGGLFLFDVNTPDKLMGMDGHTYLDETEDAFCVWRADWSSRRRICTFGLDVFRREGDLWQRGSEFHEEFAYTSEELTGYLSAAGFSRIRTFGDKKLRPPVPGEGRIFFTARKDIAP